MIFSARTAPSRPRHTRHNLPERWYIRLGELRRVTIAAAVRVVRVLCEGR